MCLGRLGRSSSSDKSDIVFENIFGVAPMRRPIAIEAILSDRMDAQRGGVAPLILRSVLRITGHTYSSI